LEQLNTRIIQDLINSLSFMATMQEFIGEYMGKS